MKILITSIIDPLRSAYSRLHQFLEYLETNHELTIICPNDSWKSEQAPAEIYQDGYHDLYDGIEVNYLFENPLVPTFQEAMSYFVLQRILRRLNLRRYDVHLNYNALISGYLVAKKLRSYNVKTVFDIADDLPQMIAVSPQLPRSLRHVGAVVGRKMMMGNIATANHITYTSRFLKNRYEIPEEKCLRIPNGVDTELFKPCSGDKMKADLGLDGSFVVGYVGVLREWVDLTPFFEVILKLCRRGIDAKLLVLGEEGGLKSCADIASRTGAAEKVVFTGTVPHHEVPKYIACMDVCLIPFVPGEISQAACPLKLFEYMACGKPVVSTRLNGVLGEVGDRILYVEDQRTAYQALRKLYDDIELRKEMATRGREFVERRYSWSHIVPVLERALLENSHQS